MKNQTMNLEALKTLKNLIIHTDRFEGFYVQELHRSLRVIIGTIAGIIAFSGGLNQSADWFDRLLNLGDRIIKGETLEEDEWTFLRNLAEQGREWVTQIQSHRRAA